MHSTLLRVNSIQMVEWKRVAAIQIAQWLLSMGLTKINLKWLIIGTSVASRVLMFRAECLCVIDERAQDIKGK